MESRPASNSLLTAVRPTLSFPLKKSRLLELKAKRTVVFSLADRTPIEREVSECYISLPEGDGHRPVILGEPGDEALLGANTLKESGLVFESVHAHVATDGDVACLNPGAGS